MQSMKEDETPDHHPLASGKSSELGSQESPNKLADANEPEKQKRQARRINYQEMRDQDDEFETMLMNEEREYQAAKRRRLEARGYTEVSLLQGTPSPPTWTNLDLGIFHQRL